jgi:hypothetical protein
VVVPIRTANGTIELIGLPNDAEVFVDGNAVDVKLPRGGKRPVITVTAEEKHRITVKSGGIGVSGGEVTVHAHGVEPFTVRAVPVDAPRPPNADVAGRASQSDVVNSPPPSPGRRTPGTVEPPPKSAGNAGSETKTAEAVKKKPEGEEDAPSPLVKREVEPKNEPAGKPAAPRAVTAASTGYLLAPGDSGRGAVWAYTTNDPDPRWKELNFDDRNWLPGEMGFAGTPRVGVNTLVRDKPVWLRAKPELGPLSPADTLVLHANHGGGYSVYVNGQFLYEARGGAGDCGAGDYHDYRLGPQQMSLFKPGPNVIAITAAGGRFFFRTDIGLKLFKSDKDADAKNEPVRRLFDGNGLAGWSCLPNMWRLDGESLVGAPLAGDRKNSFLISHRKYHDFELTFKARVTASRPGVGKSGVLFRAKPTGNENLNVAGLECDIGESPMKSHSRSAPEVYKKDEFNEFTIRCVGKHVTTTVNGFTMVDEDCRLMPQDGVIAWKLYGSQPPKQAVFKDVTIREITARRPSDHP